MHSSLTTAALSMLGLSIIFGMAALIGSALATL
jgi:hypothetical protein